MKFEKIWLMRALQPLLYLHHCQKVG